MSTAADYSHICEQTSKTITKHYSTSFSSALLLLDSSIRQHIYNIYGFVRVADEIVDTLRPKNMAEIIDALQADVMQAITHGTSANVAVHGFAQTVRTYHIPKEYITAFIYSMRVDIDKTAYSQKEYKQYIYGSAEVVGLMCLHVFYQASSQGAKKIHSAEPSAKALGAAFQKVNFLRDIAGDYEQLGRHYFPNCDFAQFSDSQKTEIINDVAKDFVTAKKAIKNLPPSSKYAVLLAYDYYHSLFKKIKKIPADQILNNRIRINNIFKFMLFSQLYLRKLLKI